MTHEEKYNYMVENGIATEEEINLVCCINGCSQDTLDEIFWARTGYHTFEAYDYYEGICQLPANIECRDPDEVDSYLNEYDPEELLAMLL